MGKWHLERLGSSVSAITLCMLAGCGGHRPPGPSLVPAKITLSPATSASLQLGATITFTASAQNSAGTAISPAFTFQSSDTSILNIAPNGVACAGRWDATFGTCTPGGTGSVQVTASAVGTTSPPTLVFVHPPIDNITVTEVLNTTPPPSAGPCFPQTQSITLQATAWSQNSDVTATVGPFTWTANNASVVTITPILNSAFNIATNQATATAATPGLTQIYASASGVSSSAFRQKTPDPSLVWDFFETCPVQSITLQLTPNGVQTGQTSFTTNKGTAQPTTATVTDVLGNSSLLNNTGAPVLTKIPLTWSSSEPMAVSAAACTDLSCSIGTPGAGAGSVTASCTPPTCNIGFPQVPPGLASPACVDFNGNSCLPYIPVPVYASAPSPLPSGPIPEAGAISGVVAGAPTATNVVATSVDCAANNLCTTDLYNVSTSTNLAGNPVALPVPPNSVMFDLAGDKAYMGSQFGAQLITTSNLSSSTNPFTTIGTVTGNILAISPNGNFAIFSDTVHSPNQVYVTNVASAASPAISPFKITGAIAAAFSPDNLKAYILGCITTSAVPCKTPAGAPASNTLYVYSTLQSLQTIPLTAPATSVVFSSNGAFAFLAGGSSASPIAVFDTCDNSIDTRLDSAIAGHISRPPLFLTVVPTASFPLPTLNIGAVNVAPVPSNVLVGLDSSSVDLIATVESAIQFPPTPPIVPTGSCPQLIDFPSYIPATGPPALKFLPLNISLNVGALQPVAFFTSPNTSQLYILTTDRSSILVYNFNTGVLSGIELAGNATPLAPLNPLQTVAGISTDGTLLYVAASDGLLHQISTTSAVDLTQTSFPNLPSLPNPFCSRNSPSGQACKLDVVAVKP
jgi:hypothetical protein